MKKLLAAAAFAFLGTGAFAQTSQGTVAVSGSLGFNSSVDDHHGAGYEPKSSSFNIMPQVGYFFKDGLEVGIGLGYQHSKQDSRHYGYDSVYDVESTINTYSFNPYVRKYFPLSENFALFAMGSGSLDRSNIKSKGQDTGYGRSYSFTTETDVNGFSLGITPGFSFFPTPKIGLNASFGFLGYKEARTLPETEGNNFDTTKSSFGLNLNSSTLNFGFSYFISR